MRRFKSEEWLVLAETEIGYHEGTHSSRLGVYSQLGHKVVSATTTYHFVTGHLLLSTGNSY